MARIVRRQKKEYAEVGYFLLPFGRHEIHQPLEYTPRVVLVSSSPEDGQVCQGDLDWLASYPLEGGFQLIADIRSNQSWVTWVTIVD